MPLPTGVVSGPLIPTRYFRYASIVASGSQSSNCFFAFSPAYTSYQAIFFFPPYAFATEASSTATDAFQMSGPVPSPSMNGRIGWSGTLRVPEEDMVMASPDLGASNVGMKRPRSSTGRERSPKASRRISAGQPQQRAHHMG